MVVFKDPEVELDLIYLSKEAEKWGIEFERLLGEVHVDGITIKPRNVRKEHSIKNQWIGICKASFDRHIDVDKSIPTKCLPVTEFPGMIIIIGEEYMKTGTDFEIETRYPDNRIRHITIAGFPNDKLRARRAIKAFIEGDFSNTDRNKYNEGHVRQHEVAKGVNSSQQVLPPSELCQQVAIEHGGKQSRVGDMPKIDVPSQPPRKRQVYIKYLSSLPRRAFSDFTERYISTIDPIWKKEEEPVEEGSVCIVVCFTLSRLLDDISAVVNITPKDCTNILVVIQNCREGIAPGPMLKHNPDKCFTDFTNILYGDGECYDCDINSRAKKTIQSFINSY